jgi:hypothetical protein
VSTGYDHELTRRGEIWSNESTDPFEAFAGLYAADSGNTAQLDPDVWTGIN